ncbi:uncharacterized protein LOC118198389 isoform X2 [Stegodyphus dumicola]|uniref:uncharacterized protein LOC118198389 isoform X2 n=1 Tax=Stegodyphus dumicola TaxID=202533 RepID=UPI0015B24D1D|nr:uncharacterized protein LOC118198389 isoform X2 [Stegodyphus dumicola]
MLGKKLFFIRKFFNDLKKVLSKAAFFITCLHFLRDHFAHLYGPAAAIEDHKPLLLHKVSTEEDDILEVLPPVAEEEEEEAEQRDEADIQKLRRHSTKFDMQEPDEAKPLRSKKTGRSIVKFAIGERNSEASAVPKRPPLLKRQTTLALFAKPPEEDASRVLQKALLDNPYNKFHHKYNPNLVYDEDQDMTAHLRKRRLRARRLTMLAMHNNSLGTPERRLSSTDEEPAINNPLVPLAASFFIERAQRRRALRKDIPKEASAEAVPTQIS